MPISHEAGDLIGFLNSLVELDREAMTTLVAARVPCNEALARHSTVQVFAEARAFHVGLLGILNGYCGTLDSGPLKGWGPITAVLNGDGALVRFERTKAE